MGYRVIKIKEEFYQYIRKIGKRDFGTDQLSTPYLIYLIIRKYEHNRKR